MSSNRALRPGGPYGIDYTLKSDLTVQDFLYREREVGPLVALGDAYKYAAYDGLQGLQPRDTL